MFGFVQCDLSVSDELKATFSNFPPFFQKMMLPEAIFGNMKHTVEKRQFHSGHEIISSRQKRQNKRVFQLLTETTDCATAKEVPANFLFQFLA